MCPLLLAQDLRQEANIVRSHTRCRDYDLLGNEQAQTSKLFTKCSLHCDVYHVEVQRSALSAGATAQVIRCTMVARHHGGRAAPFEIA